MGALLDEVGFQEIHEHDIVTGTVVSVDDNEAYVDIHIKQEIPIPKNELAYPAPLSAKDVVKVGDQIEVFVVAKGGEHGATLSKVKADNLAAWKAFEGIVERQEVVRGKVSQVVKGGLVVIVNGLRAFIPASHVDLHFVKDLSSYLGQEIEALAIECDPKKRRLVLSRKKLLERERLQNQELLFESLEVGQTLQGVVKRLVDYGAFIDIGGVDGLAHVSDLSWERVKSPADVLKVGQEVDVYVKSFDPEKKRISLSIKDTMIDPWFERTEKFHEGQIVTGKIMKLTDFGVFMELEPGFDGLIPMGELSDKRLAKADEVVKVGDEVSVKILHIDKKRKRISLSLKKAQEK